MKTRSIIANLFLLATLAVISGCATAGYKQADKTGQGIAEFRDQVIKGKKAVDAAMANLTKTSETAATNPRKAYEAFSKSVDRVEAARAGAGRSAAEMKSQGTAYFKQWEKQLAQIENPEVRALAEKRKATLNEVFARISPLVQQAKTDFDPFLSDLKDLRTFLSNDLTVSGVDAAKGIIKQTREAGTKLQGSLDDLIAEMNCISATLTPAKK